MQRNQSIDALRGFAILAMILSGSISFGDSLPAWMYHAQVPPPAHRFNEHIAGITWVDLVFPFFLFALGAAIPLSLHKKASQQVGFLSILWIAAKRWLLLIFFALFTEHMKAWVLGGGAATATEYLYSIFAFILLFFQFFHPSGDRYKKMFRVLKLTAFLLAALLLYLLQFGGKSFSFYRSDIILVVLANMAFFGSISWWLTKDRRWIRLGILPLIMAVFLAAKEPGQNWTKDLFNFSHIGPVNVDWGYQFYFLKYLFIVLPGTIAGDWFLQYKVANESDEFPAIHLKMIGLLSFVLIISNIIFLFNRQLLLNLLLSSVILTVMYILFREAGKEKNPLLYHFFSAGAYLLLLGLFFEAYEGGIKKDHSTYSYYFVTSGMAFFMLTVFNSLSLSAPGAAVNHYLGLNGRNPMVAYVAGSLLLTPVLYLTRAIKIFDWMNHAALTGFLKGLLFTGIVSAITILFTRRGWFWKT